MLPADTRISAVTLAELSVGPLVARSDSERAARQAHLQYAEADFDPLSFDATAARAFGQVAASLRAFGQVAASLRAFGRTSSDRSYDAMTAATAIAHSIPLYTFNPRDFEGINDLTVVALPHPGPGSDLAESA